MPKKQFQLYCNKK